MLNFNFKNFTVWKNRINSTFSFKQTKVKQLAQQGIEQTLPPKQTRQPLPRLLNSILLLWIRPLALQKIGNISVFQIQVGSELAKICMYIVHNVQQILITLIGKIQAFFQKLLAVYNGGRSTKPKRKQAFYSTVQCTVQQLKEIKVRVTGT